MFSNSEFQGILGFFSEIESPSLRASAVCDFTSLRWVHKGMWVKRGSGTRIHFPINLAKRYTDRNSLTPDSVRTKGIIQRLMDRLRFRSIENDLSFERDLPDGREGIRARDGESHG